MAPLVESVIALEEKADDLVAQARQAAKDVDKKAQAEIASSRQEIEEVVKRQIETFRREAEKKHQEDLQRADKEFESAMAALDRIDPAVIARYPHQKRSMERLAAYLIRASFSQERMDYLPEEAAVICHSKDGKEKRTYDALEWIAAMGTHVPLRGEQMVRYYGEFSNCLRGRRRKAECVEAIPTVLEPQISTAEARKNWASGIRSPKGLLC